jgi:hypothetical protein
MLIVALISLLCFILQSAHFHSLSYSVRSELWYPQTGQLLDDGTNLPIKRMVFFLIILIYILILLQNYPTHLIHYSLR